MKIQVGKFYKTFDDKTMIIQLEQDEIFWADWHEQALYEPNHGMIPYDQDGYYLNQKLCFSCFSSRLIEQYEIDLNCEYNIKREVTEEEQKQIEKDFDDLLKADEEAFKKWEEENK